MSFADVMAAEKNMQIHQPGSDPFALEVFDPKAKKKEKKLKTKVEDLQEQIEDEEKELKKQLDKHRK